VRVRRILFRSCNESPFDAPTYVSHGALLAVLTPCSIRSTIASPLTLRPSLSQRRHYLAPAISIATFPSPAACTTPAVASPVAASRVKREKIDCDDEQHGADAGTDPHSASPPLAAVFQSSAASPTDGTTATAAPSPTLPELPPTPLDAVQPAAVVVRRYDVLEAEEKEAERLGGDLERFVKPRSGREKQARRNISYLLLCNAFFSCTTRTRSSWALCGQRGCGGDGAASLRAHEAGKRLVAEFTSKPNRSSHCLHSSLRPSPSPPRFPHSSRHIHLLLPARSLRTVCRVTATRARVKMSTRRSPIRMRQLTTRTRRNPIFRPPTTRTTPTQNATTRPAGRLTSPLKARPAPLECVHLPVSCSCRHCARMLRCHRALQWLPARRLCSRAPR